KYHPLPVSGIAGVFAQSRQWVDCSGRLLAFYSVRRHRERPQAHPDGIEDRVPNRGRESNDRSLPRARRRQILAIDQYRFNHWNVTKPRNSVPREARIHNRAVIKVELLEQSTTDSLHNRALNLIL